MQCGCDVVDCENRVFVDGRSIAIVSPQNPMWVTLPSGDYLPTRERRVTLTPDQMRELAADLLRVAGKAD